MSRIHLIILIIILSFLLVPRAEAQTEEITSPELLIDPISITARMEVNGTTHISIHGGVTNLSNASINQIRFRIESIDLSLRSTSFDYNPAQATITRMERHSMILITLTETLEAGSSGQLDIEVISKDFQSPLEISDDGNSMQGSFVYYMRPHVAIANFTFTTILPEYYSLSDESLVPIFPNSDSNYTDGKSLIFVWETPSLQAGQERAFIIRYQADHVETVANTSPFLILTILLVGIAIGSVLTFIVPKAVQRIENLGKVEYLGITSEEEELLGIIKEKGGSCSQKELYRRLPISESKVSLLLGNLEERGAIRRVRDGRENMVYLSED